jgi:hypothetical protein
VPFQLDIPTPHQQRSVRLASSTTAGKQNRKAKPNSASHHPAQVPDSYRILSRARPEKNVEEKKKKRKERKREREKEKIIKEKWVASNQRQQ